MQTVNRVVQFLLVEDDDDHARLVERTLGNAGLNCNLTRVKDGVDAVRVLERQDEFADAPRPDLVLLDLNLPRVSGHKVLEAVKSNEDLRSIPIVVMTSSDDERDRAAAYASHANSYVVKPIDFAKFRQMVHDLSRYWGFWNQIPDREELVN